MTTQKRTRKTKDQMIAALEAKLAKLKTPGEAKKEAKLDKDSPGVAELLAAFDAAVKKNGVKSGEMLIALAKMKSARVKITSSQAAE